LLVTPTIRNLKVTKMLGDGGAGLNLISPKVIRKLQIAEEELKVTGTFQGINPDWSRPKEKITLPVTFGGELNYWTEKIVFDEVDLPCRTMESLVAQPWPNSWRHPTMPTTL